MKLPRLASISAGRSATDAFGGYNHNLRIGDGEWYDMKNMTSDFYPVMSPRGKRGTWANDEVRIGGVVVNNGICYVDSVNRFVLPNGVSVSMGLSEAPKDMVSMGAYVIILPDKKWINVASCLDALEKGEEVPEDAWGDIEASYTGEVEIDLCKEDGTLYENSEIAETKPSDPADGQLWLDRDGNTPMLKRWAKEASMWTLVQNVFNKITMTAATKNSFLKDDSVNISTDETIGVGVISHVLGIRRIAQVGSNYIIIDGDLPYNGLGVSGAEITIDKKMPDLDIVIESGNRLWGCKYGSTDKGFLNEIYASKLGDFKNWNSFQGVSTDSYTASIGEGGPFTGAVNYGGRPYFFKENCMIEVYGAYPAQYQVQTTPCKGVQAGCEKSLAVVNNVLFYKSLGGVCAFDGSLPTVISSAFGTLDYKNAVGGGVGNKYYISMQGMDDEWNLFVYDTTKGFWHKEDDLHVVELVGYGNELYGVSENRGEVIAMLGSINRDESDIEWMVQSGEIGLSLPDAKYVTRLTVRMSLEEGSEVSFFVQYDFEEEWIHLCTIPGTSLRSFDIPIRPKRCDHMKLRLEGIGGAKIYSITKTIEQGSDVM